MFSPTRPSSGRMLKYIEIPADVSDPVICCNTRLESLKLSMDPAYFIPTLLRSVSAMTEGGGSINGTMTTETDDVTSSTGTRPVSSSSGTTSGSSGTTSSGGGLGWSNILPFPTYNEWQGNNSPLIFMRRGKDGARNKRAEILLDTMSDKIGSKRKMHCYGNIVVFWRKYVDEGKHQMKLSDFSVDDLKLICPNMLPACPSSPLQQPATHSYAAALNVSASSPSASLSSPKVAAASPPLRPVSNSPHTAGTVPRSRLLSSQSTKDYCAVVSTFLDTLSQNLPDVQEAVNSAFTQETMLREEIGRLSAELVATQMKSDTYMSQLLATREECESLRKSVERLSNQIAGLENHTQASPEPEQVKKEEAELNQVEDEVRASRESVNAGEFEPAWADEATDADREKAAVNGTGAEAGSTERPEGEPPFPDVWRVIQVYHADVPDPTDNSTMWGQFEEGELVTVQERTDGGWWYVSGSKDQKGWYPEAYLAYP
eukprot:GHVS01094295.1.p1 GENE.GHVS01094295.1~~GHVS01094295.1.p1  ORF type:complete len:487 (+),score=63.68 GHVS01094295.1:464-1924(+)